MRFLLILSVFSIIPTFSWAQDSSESQCRLDLQACWQEVFPQVAALSQDAERILLAYEKQLALDEARLKTSFTEIENKDTREALILSESLSLLKRSLAECEMLRAGWSTRDLDVIVVGQHFSKDGKNFALAAETSRRLRVEAKCKGLEEGTSAYLRCKESVVVLQTPSKEDLLRWFSLLPEDSIKTFTYFGHGLENGLLMGPKTMLLPSSWHSDMKITPEEWREKMEYTLYADNLYPPSDVEPNSLVEAWKRAMVKGAPMTLYACKTGNEFGPMLQSTLKSERCVVNCCTGGMNFEYWTDEKGWVSPGNSPVPENVRTVQMVPSSWIYYFGPVRNYVRVPVKERTRPEMKGDSKLAKPLSRDQPAEYPKLEQSRRDIVLRLIYRSGDRAWIESKNQMVIFTPEESKILERLFSDFLGDESWKDTFTMDVYDQLRRENIKLFDKVEALVAESLRLYYQ